MLQIIFIESRGNSSLSPHLFHDLIMCFTETNEKTVFSDTEVKFDVPPNAKHINKKKSGCNCLVSYWYIRHIFFGHMSDGHLVDYHSYSFAVWPVQNYNFI
ncbi:Uncharacterised protein at_DN0287 [Pycnogonum litorale]